VDDDPVNQLVASTALRSHKWEVVKCMSGTEVRIRTRLLLPRRVGDLTTRGSLVGNMAAGTDQRSNCVVVGVFVRMQPRIAVPSMSGHSSQPTF
jgi:hypothetical protein